MVYNNYVIKGILATNQFNITEVHNLESLKIIYFLREEYDEMKNLIEAGNIEGIKAFREDQPRTQEYLDVMVFSDQNKKPYIVTVYDSDALEQDPQVIEIYSV